MLIPNMPPDAALPPPPPEEDPLAHAEVAGANLGMAPGGAPMGSLDPAIVAQVFAQLRDMQAQDAERLPMMQQQLARHVAQQMGLLEPSVVGAGGFAESGAVAGGEMLDAEDDEEAMMPPAGAF